MRKNRLRELRQKHGLTVEALAEMAGVHHSTVSRIENEKRGLSFDLAERFAQAMDTTAPQVMGLDLSEQVVRLRGMEEDAVPYVPDGPPLPFQKRHGASVDEWEIRSSAVDRTGIKPGTIAFVDISAKAVENIAPLKCVIAQIYDDKDLTKAKTIVRQFVPPSLLITNSSEANGVPLDLEKGEAYIKGVIIGHYQRA